MKTLKDLQRELEETREAFKLCIGRRTGEAWTEVKDSEIDAYIQHLRYIKQERLKRDEQGRNSSRR